MRDPFPVAAPSHQGAQAPAVVVRPRAAAAGAQYLPDLFGPLFLLGAAIRCLRRSCAAAEAGDLAEAQRWNAHARVFVVAYAERGLA